MNDVQHDVIQNGDKNADIQLKSLKKVTLETTGNPRL